MHRSTTFRALALAASCAGTMAIAAPAVAANPLGCRASGGSAQAAFPGAPKVEPLVANNPTTPCLTNSATTFNGLNVGPAGGPNLFIGTSGAFTGSNALGYQPAAEALASAANASMTTQYGQMAVQAVQSQADYQCNDGILRFASSSKVLGVQLGGKDIVPLNGGTLPFTYHILDPQGNDTGSYIQLNQTDVSTPGALIQRAVLVHLNGFGDFVLGESEVTGTAANCPVGYGDPFGNANTSTLAPIGPCPTGSAYNPLTLRCEIPASGSVAAISVSKPFQGPTGGTVMSLAAARALYPSNPCVKGQGPNFVIVGTNKADRINGTRNADRIIGLEGDDRLAGQGGADCISDGNGKDRIFAGNGNARITVGNGNDRVSSQNGHSTITAGNGKDRIVAGNGNVTVKTGKGAASISVGNGNDKITVGNGKSVVKTGNGNNTIKVGTGADRIRVGNGKSKVTAHGKKAQVSCGSTKSRAYVLKSAAAFARRHGCSVTIIKK
jgi:Ca2+-binding RTX toxin-like protein